MKKQLFGATKQGKKMSPSFGLSWHIALCTIWTKSVKNLTSISCERSKLGISPNLLQECEFMVYTISNLIMIKSKKNCFWEKFSMKLLKIKLVTRQVMWGSLVLQLDVRRFIFFLFSYLLAPQQTFSIMLYIVITFFCFWFSPSKNNPSFCLSHSS